VGRRPTPKIEYFALCDAPIIPEKCAPDGYSNGCVAFVQVLLMMTVYSPARSHRRWRRSRRGFRSAFAAGGGNNGDDEQVQRA